MGCSRQNIEFSTVISLRGYLYKKDNLQKTETYSWHLQDGLLFKTAIYS